jgi:hypothetical protein
MMPRVNVEPPFLFSMAGLNASLAGLAGLVAGLRHGAEIGKVNQFRLREIVEFAFANVLFAVAVIPLSELLASVELTVRLLGIAALFYLAANFVLQVRRQRQMDIHLYRGWVIGVLSVNIAAAVASIAAIVFGLLAAYACLLLLLLMRPMGAFLLVLGETE